MKSKFTLGSRRYNIKSLCYTSMSGQNGDGLIKCNKEIKLPNLSFIKYFQTK